MKIRNGFVSNSSSSSFIVCNVTIATMDSQLTALFRYIDDTQEQGNKLSDNFMILKNNYSDLYANFLNGKYGLTMHTVNYDTYITYDGSEVKAETCNNLNWENLNLTNMITESEDSDSYNKIYLDNRRWLNYFIDLDYINNKNNIHSADIYPSFSVTCKNCSYAHSIVFNEKLEMLCSNCLSPVSSKKIKIKKDKKLIDKAPLTLIG